MTRANQGRPSHFGHNLMAPAGRRGGAAAELSRGERRSSTQERILGSFGTDRGRSPGPRKDGHVIVEGEQALADRAQDERAIAPPKIGPANAALKQRIAGEHDGVGTRPTMETDA